jgi:septum site-determining protein MinC
MISIKGIRQGLLVILDPRETNWDEQLLALEKRLSQGASFFKGGSVALDVGEQALNTAQIERARSTFERFDVKLWAVLGGSAATLSAAAHLGFHTSLPAPPPPAPTLPQEPAAPLLQIPGGLDISEGVLIQSKLRSGVVVRHPGHILVIGDVNPGAFLYAGGDIIVWGSVKGDVHAGALGDSSARICALAMETQLLRIADVTTRYVPGKRGKQARPEMAEVVNREIIVNEWKP